MHPILLLTSQTGYWKKLVLGGSLIFQRINRIWFFENTKSEELVYFGSLIFCFSKNWPTLGDSRRLIFYSQFLKRELIISQNLTPALL
jgi:hypothetical protein